MPRHILRNRDIRDAINREAAWNFFNPWTLFPLGIEIAGAVLTLIPIALKHSFDECADSEGRLYFSLGLGLSMLGFCIQLINNIFLRLNNRAHRLYFFGEKVLPDEQQPQRQEAINKIYTGDTSFNAWSEWTAAFFPGLGIVAGIFCLTYLFAAVGNNDKRCDFLKFASILGQLGTGLLSAAGTDRLSSANSQLTALKKYQSTNLEFLASDDVHNIEADDPDIVRSTQCLNPCCR